MEIVFVQAAEEELVDAVAHYNQRSEGPAVQRVYCSAG